MMKTVKFQVVRQEVWYPEYEVPAHLEGDELIEYISNEAPASVFDEMCKQGTLDTEFNNEIYSIHVEEV
jgi:hypothetical protein